MFRYCTRGQLSRHPIETVYINFLFQRKIDTRFLWLTSWHRIVQGVAYLVFRRNNLLFDFRLVVTLLPFVPFVIPFGVSFNLAFCELAFDDCCTANNFSSRFECFFVPVRFCRKHNITLRVIAQCTRARNDTNT